MDKSKFTEKVDDQIRSDTRGHFPPAEPVDTDDNNNREADASGDGDDEREDENEAVRSGRE